MVGLLVGLGLIFVSTKEPLATAANPELGNLLAVGAGFSWALTILGLRWLAVRSIRHDEQPEAAVVTGCFVAFLAAVLPAFPLEESGWVNWLIVIYLGVFQIGLAYVFITEGMRHVPALESSLLLLAEPVFSPVWAWLLLAEMPGALVLIGGLVVIVATAAHALGHRGGTASHADA